MRLNVSFSHFSIFFSSEVGKKYRTHGDVDDDNDDARVLNWGEQITLYGQEEKEAKEERREDL